MLDIDLSVAARGRAPTVVLTPAPRDELRVVRQGYCGLVVLATIVQLLVFSREPDNLLSTVLASASSLIGISYALHSRRFNAHPISALILLFFTTTSTAGALLVKSLEWSALSDRLQIPISTFGMLLAMQLILLVSDRIYLYAKPARALREFVSVRILKRWGVLDWPSDRQLWMLGLLGCASVVLTGTDYESGPTFGIAFAGAKLIRAFGFLKFAPFLIPFRNALSGTPSRVRLPLLALGLYFAALIGISFATNSRSTFADAVPTIGICLLLGKAVGLIDFRSVSRPRLIGLLLGAAVVGLVLSRVALAMVVVREYRYSVDTGTLIRTTMEALVNSEWLEAAKAKMESSINIADYSETYVDSRFFARFLLTKVHDNILYYLDLFGPDHIRTYQQFMFDRFAATLPDPLLRLIGLDIDKQDLVISNGDYIVYMIDGWGLGGFKTGSMISEVYVVFGWAFPLVMLGSALLLFVFHDAFVLPNQRGRVAFSPLILLLIWNLVGTTAAFGFGAETVTAIPAGIVRGLPQDILAYLIAVRAVRALGRLFGRR